MKGYKKSLDFLKGGLSPYVSIIYVFLCIVTLDIESNRYKLYLTF